MRRLFHRSPAFDAAAAGAAARAEVWRIALGLLLILAVYAALIAWAMLAPAAILGRVDELNDMATGATRLGMLILLASFAAGWAAVAAVTVALHRRRPLATAGRLRWARFWPAALWVVGIGVVSLAVTLWLTGAGPARQADWGAWALTLVAAIPLLAVQTGAEELVFRGYLQQHLAARFRSPLVWAVFPSILFGAIHWNPAAYGGNAPMIVGVIAFTALFLAAVTARTGDISAAWGAHFGLNFVALLVVGLDGDLSGLALFTLRPEGDLIATGLMVDLACLTLGGAAGLWLMTGMARYRGD